MPGGRAPQVRIGRKTVLRFRHTDRQVAISGVFPFAQLSTDFLVRQHLVRVINPLGDGFNFLKQRHVVGI